MLISGSGDSYVTYYTVKIDDGMQGPAIAEDELALPN